MDQIQSSKQTLSSECKEVNIQNIGYQQIDGEPDQNQLIKNSDEIQSRKTSENQQIDVNNEDDLSQSKEDSNKSNNQQDDSEVSEKEKSEEDVADDDDDFDFDFEKIKQRAEARQSHLPSWFLETDKQINNYNNKAKDVQDKLEDLGQGLKEFEEKRKIQELKLKEERRMYLIKKYQQEDTQEEEEKKEQEQKYKGAFFSLNQHILIKILHFLERDLVPVLLKMSRVCKKLFYLSVNDDVWKNICREMLGLAFVDLNESNKTLYAHKMQQIQQTQEQQKQNQSINRQSSLTLKSQKSKEIQKHGSITTDYKTYWKNVAQYFYREFNLFKITLKNYRNQNCPQVIFARSDMIKGLKLVNEIFSLVTLNRHKLFGMYCKLMALLKDSFIKGTYCLSQMALMDEENIRYDAFDALFTFISLEETELPKFRIFQSISNFLNKCKFTEERKLKALLTSEIAEIQKLGNITFDRPSLFFTSYLYNQRLLVPDTDIYCNYDINNNQTDIQSINTIIQSNHLHEFVGFTLKRETNQIFELSGQITFKGDKFEGFGMTSDSGNFEMNGSLKFTHNQTLKKIYEIYNTVSNFGKGSTSLTTTYSQIQAPKSYQLYATFTQVLEQTAECSQIYEPKQFLTLYGASENLRDIIVIKI